VSGAGLSSMSTETAESSVVAGECGPVGLEEGSGTCVALSDEARLVLFGGGGGRAKFSWAQKVANAIVRGPPTVSAEEARAVAVKSWTGDLRMSCRYGRDVVPSRTPLRVLLDCTDVVLVVAEYLGVEKSEKVGAEACLCLGAFGGHRAMVDVASTALFGTEGVAQRRLAVQYEGNGLGWWAGAGGQGAMFRELVWGESGGDAAWKGAGAPGRGVPGALAGRTLSSEVILSALGGAAYGGLLGDCWRCCS
jgi:hypothetical protein